MVGEQARQAAKGRTSPETKEGLLAVVYGAVASLFMAAFAATNIAAATVTGYFKVGRSAGGYDMAFSLALFGAGYLVGLSVGVAMGFGLVIAWGAAVPILSTMTAQGSQPLADFVHDLWLHKVRFIGAGTIAVAAVWTLTKLAAPVVRGTIATMAASRSKMRARPIGAISHVAALDRHADHRLPRCHRMAVAGVPRHHAACRKTSSLVITALPFIFFGGFIVAAICGYMAG